MYVRKDWIYIDLRKVFYLDISSPFKEMKKLKGVFKPLKRYFRCGKDWFPVLWCSKPAWIHIMSHGVGWKDKYDSPRFEVPPYIWIHLFGYNFIWYWGTVDEINNDDYWEQALWYLYYYGNISYGSDVPDIKKATESWPWMKENDESSWNNKFLEL